MRGKRRNNLCILSKNGIKEIKTLSKEEVDWVSMGIRAYLMAHLGTDKFPKDFYNEAKRLIGYTK
jgi:hypothetical protein